MRKLLFLALIAAVACKPAEVNPPVDNPEETPENTPEKTVEEVPAEYASYTRVPLNSVLHGVQPMTGIVLWTGQSKGPEGYISMEFSYMLYSDVCKEKDVYDWTVVDKLLDQVAANGHQAIMRFRYTYPGKKCAVPDYIKAWPGYEETEGKADGGHRTWFPDWRCEELQRFHMEFYRLFAERYDNDPRIAFLETGFGLWAEYHIYDGPFILGKTFPSKEFQAEFISNMPKWFKNTPWLISIDAADNTYSPFRKQPELLEVDFGNFDDSFMCEDHDGYNRRSWLFFGQDRYQKSPEGGEFSYYSTYDQRHCLDTAGMYGRRFEDEVARYHLSFIIGADQPSYQKWPRIIEASQSMGYRYRIKDFRVKAGTGAAVWVKNAGVAPIYYDAFLDVDGVRSSYNLRGLMPGDSLWVDINNPAVKDTPVLSIACDRLVPGQKIEYEADIQ